MASVSRTYRVRALRWEKGWELHIDGVGVTQARKLNEAEEMARDYIALELDVPEGSFAIEITPDVGASLNEGMRRARRVLEVAELAQRNAVHSSRDIVRRLRDEGLSGREIAVALKITPQRVSQLLKSDDAGSERLRAG